MAKIPEKPEEVFVPLTQDYLNIFGNELVALIIYGSAASGFYVRGKSDINLLVVTTAAGMEKFTDALDTVKAWRKRRVAVPLVMTADFIKTSLDSYPIEFLNMKNSHTVIYGKDILGELTFKADDLRLQIERELRGKLILLRQSYYEAEGGVRVLRNIIAKSLTAFVSIFHALIYFKEGKSPQGRRDVIKEASRLFAIDEAVFMLCADIKEGKDKLSAKEVAAVYSQYLKEIDKLCNIFDKL